LNGTYIYIYIQTHGWVSYSGSGSPFSGGGSQNLGGGQKVKKRVKSEKKGQKGEKVEKVEKVRFLVKK